MEEIYIERNVVFAQTDKEYLTSDVYRPCEGEDLPAVILIHGGWYQSGSKEMYKEWGSYLAEAGFVAMAINYRLMTPTYSIYPEVMDDIRAAVNWLVSKSNEWNIEPQRLGLIGDSAGAHLAAQFSFQHATNASYKIRAVVGAYGIYDFEKMWHTSPETHTRLERFLGNAFSEAKEKYREASPMYRINEAVSHPIFDTSYFITWGETDKVVHPSQSESFIQKLEEANIETKKLAISDAGHFWFNILPGIRGGILKDYPNAEVAPQILKFLKENLCIQEVGNFSMKRIQELKKML
ncbi:alpha/beta hydrolase [Salicibibacter kimchii]|uniref:Alpha/beta hydrolase n=1 Tax=Salicibibacter kimchii TaxID=2099786 RepID=A0A345C169_9BACI|nr:alpha/beta hydrolase [Salicibibacter kimchii]AXF56950.1 alpha/beta hydrolase [Salicibibacter kimchii]